MEPPAPFATRPPEDEAKFKHPSDDPLIEPDHVSPSVEGYFRLPAIWVGKAPDPETVSQLNPGVHHVVVLMKSLGCGIDACVFQDGTFLFDFSSWPLAPQVKIPGYRKPGLGVPYRATPENTAAMVKAEAYAHLRAQTMNVHQLCLSAAEMTVKRRIAALMGFPVTSSDTLKGINFNPPPYHDDVEDFRALARNVMNNKGGACQPTLARRVIELEVVDESLSLLDKILSACDPWLIQFVETFYLASCSASGKRLGEALMLAWATCEQMLSSMWNKRLDEVPPTSDAVPRMTKDRRNKLKGRDYPISVVIEMLELEGRIPHKLYRLLDVSRKARNYWIHELRVPKQQEVLACMHAAQTLLQGLVGIYFPSAIGGRGGVPQWNYWIWASNGRIGR
jgi:hypothetical protein